MEAEINSKWHHGGCIKPRRSHYRAKRSVAKEKQASGMRQTVTETEQKRQPEGGEGWGGGGGKLGRHTSPLQLQSLISSHKAPASISDVYHRRNTTTSAFWGKTIVSWYQTWYHKLCIYLQCLKCSLLEPVCYNLHCKNGLWLSLGRSASTFG